MENKSERLNGSRNEKHNDENEYSICKKKKEEKIN